MGGNTWATGHTSNVVSPSAPQQRADPCCKATSQNYPPLKYWRPVPRIIPVKGNCAPIDATLGLRNQLAQQESGNMCNRPCPCSGGTRRHRHDRSDRRTRDRWRYSGGNDNRHSGISNEHWHEHGGQFVRSGFRWQSPIPIRKY